MPVFTALLTAILILAAGSVQAADKHDKGGLLGNSYGSQMEQLKDNIIRITSRQKVTGTLDEISTPGMPTYNSFARISDATVVRAALEAKNLGFTAVKVTATRNLSQTFDKRASGPNSCPANFCESDFTFANGHYGTDVELAIEVTFELFKSMPADLTEYIDVEKLLRQYGI